MAKIMNNDGDVLVAKPGDEVIDWKTMDIRMAIKDNRHFILVIDKRTGEMNSIWDASFFEGIADWYYRDTYGVSVNDYILERTIN